MRLDADMHFHSMQSVLIQTVIQASVPPLRCCWKPDIKAEAAGTQPKGLPQDQAERELMAASSQSVLVAELMNKVLWCALPFRHAQNPVWLERCSVKH